MECELTGINISESVMLRTLKKIGYTSKKNPLITLKQKKRDAFLEEIQKIDPEKIVYSEEAGIDDNEAILIGWAPKGERCYHLNKQNVEPDSI